MDISIVPATPVHIAAMARRARQIDRVEAYYQTGRTLPDALAYAARISSEIWAGRVDGDLVALWGVGAIQPLSGIGAPWLVATDRLNDVAIPFLRRNKANLDRLRQSYDVLRNVVYAENTSAIRWLKWMGFKMQDPRPFGPLNKPFRQFEWRTKTCAA